MSATGGTLSDSSATIDDNGSGSGELTHTTPRAVSGNDVNFNGITWDTSTTESGSFTIRACGQVVNLANLNDGDGPDDCDTMTVTVRPVINFWSGTVTYNENTQNGAYIVVDSSITLYSSANLNRAESNITNPMSGDALGCPSPAVTGISCSGTGTTSLTLTGTASRASYDLAIQRIRFRNTSQNPSTANRTVRVRVRDSSNVYSLYVSKTVDVNPQNDAPVAAQDGNPGLGNGYVSINEGAVANGVGNVLSNDSDVDGPSLTASRAGPGCAATSPTEASSFLLNSNGSINYTHDGSEPVQDSFSYCAYDGTAYSAPVIAYIDIAAVNDPPTISGFSGSTAFTEQTPVIIDNSVTFADSDSTLLNRAQITISGNYEAGDTLDCSAAPPAPISCGAFDVPSRTLTLSGTTNFTDYQTAVGLVRFNNTTDNPGLGARTIDLDVRDDSLGVSLDAQKSVTITRSNDPPTIAAIPNQNALEDTAADPFTFNYTAIASDVDVDDDINDGGASTGGTPTITYSLSGLTGALSSMTISNSSPTHGQISWNPPQTGVFGQVYGPITVRVEDGDEDGSPANSTSFSITVSPPDDDSDLVANYNDLCLTVADGSNADNDGDGTPGSDGGANDGGDVCDLDDDNDDMPDTFEIANGLDPFDASDRNTDKDGDGVSNYDEFVAGTSPNLANQVIDATGYLTSYSVAPPAPKTIHTQATALVGTINDPSRPDYPGPYRPGVNDITWTPVNSGSSDLAVSDPGGLVTNPPVQTFRIRPLVSFSANQQVEEGSAVSVTVTLNGESPAWPANPATVSYTVSGTANNPADHDAASGVVTFNDQVFSQTINFNVVNDAPLADPDETVIFTLSGPTNAVLGSKRTHRVRIVEANVAPRAGLQFTQATEIRGSTYVGNGAITIDALVTDVNTAQTHSYDWSGTDNALLPPGNVANWAVGAPVAGNYRVEVVVTDNGTPPLSTRVSRILNIAMGTAPPLGAGDTDGDGLADNDAAEGHTDSDGDGIPNYLDAVSDTHFVPNQTVNMASSYLLQTDPGLAISRGDTAQAASRFGASLTDADIADFGSPSGTQPVNATDSFRHVSGIFDFAVRGVEPGTSARVVIPLQSAIPRGAQYRKFNPAIGWGGFAVDANNRVESAPGALGACPEPGSSAYRSGLNYLDKCIQLIIQDGGPNDTDNLTNGIVTDPGTVGVRLTDPETEEVEEGGGRISPHLLLLLFSLGIIRAWRRHRETGRV